MEYETEEVVVREVKDVTIVRMKIDNLTGQGEIDRIRGEVDKLLEQGVRKLVLDFKYVRYVGSSALGMIIALNQKVKETPGAALVLSHPEHIRELLRVSRADKLFRIAADPREAIKLF